MKRNFGVNCPLIQNRHFSQLLIEKSILGTEDLHLNGIKWRLGKKLGSYVPKKLHTYPFPKPTFCIKWEVSVNVGLGEQFPRKCIMIRRLWHGFAVKAENRRENGRNEIEEKKKKKKTLSYSQKHCTIRFWTSSNQYTHTNEIWTSRLENRNQQNVNSGEFFYPR